MAQSEPSPRGWLYEYHAVAVQAELLPERAFRIYHLGNWVDQSAGWLPAGAWEGNQQAEPPPVGAEVVIAIEGTYRRTSAVVGCGLDGTVFFCWAAEAARDDELRRVLEQCANRWQVVEVVHPRRIRTGLFADLGRDELPVHEWDTSPDNEASSANEFFRAIIEGRVPHDHSPLLGQHIEAVGVRTAVDGSLRLVRPEDGAPTDAGLAASAAWWRAFQLAEALPTEPMRIY